MVATLPGNLWEELSLAALVLDINQTDEVLEHIAEIEPQLAVALKQRLTQLNFTEIQQLLNSEN